MGVLSTHAIDRESSKNNSNIDQDDKKTKITCYFHMNEADVSEGHQSHSRHFKWQEATSGNWLYKEGHDRGG